MVNNDNLWHFMIKTILRARHIFRNPVPSVEVESNFFRALNPFSSFSDSRNLRQGNPNLNPEYTSSYELNHIKYWDKSSVSSSLYYRHTTDVIQRIREINDEGITVVRPQNLATRDAWGLDLTFSTALSKIWKLDGNVNLFRQITESTEYGNTDANNYHETEQIS